VLCSIVLRSSPLSAAHEISQPPFLVVSNDVIVILGPAIEGAGSPA